VCAVTNYAGGNELLLVTFAHGAANVRRRQRSRSSVLKLKGDPGIVKENVNFPNILLY